MRCPWCGELVPDNTVICHRCGNKLREEELEAAQISPVEARITAPGDWKTVASSLPTAPPHRRERRYMRYGIAPVIYGLLVASLTAWLGLSLTLWGNPSPLDRSKALLQAIAKADDVGFLNCLLEEDRIKGQELWKEVQSHYGPGVVFANPLFRVESDDGYEAVIILTGAKLEGGKLAGKEVSERDNVRLFWVNRRGSWYLDPDRSRLTPL